MKKINSRFRIGGTSIRMPSQFCNIALFILASSDFCIFWGSVFHGRKRELETTKEW